MICGDIDVLSRIVSSVGNKFYSDRSTTGSAQGITYSTGHTTHVKVKLKVSAEKKYILI